MNFTKARKTFLKLFIAFLSLTALIAILSVLSDDFGELQFKILATTFTISAASICSMSCAAFIEKRGKRGLGLSGIICAAIAAALVIVGMWLNIDQDEYWKSTITFIVLAIALAQALLLMLPDLDANHRWTQIAATVSTGVLALQIIAAIWGEIDSTGYYKLLAVMSIVVVLLTLVIPILMKMRKRTSEIIETLLLSKNKDGTFTDSDGAAYRVSKIDTEI